MRKLMLLLLLLPIVASAQWQQVGNTLQRTSNGLKYRTNLGSPGFVYWYTKPQIDSLLGILALQPLSNGYGILGGTYTGISPITLRVDSTLLASKAFLSNGYLHLGLPDQTVDQTPNFGSGFVSLHQSYFYMSGSDQYAISTQNPVTHVFDPIVVGAVNFQNGFQMFIGQGVYRTGTSILFDDAYSSGKNISLSAPDEGAIGNPQYVQFGNSGGSLQFLPTIGRIVRTTNADSVAWYKQLLVGRNAANFGLTASLTDVAHLLIPSGNDQTVRVGAWLNLRSVSGTDSVSVKVTWTDNNSVSQTKKFKAIGVSESKQIGVVDDYPMTPMDFRVLSGTTVQISAVVTGSGTILYECGATIQKLIGDGGL